MNLHFCCPTCGADLRVDPLVASMVSCPGCGEPIRVPRKPHPVEATELSQLLSRLARVRARLGLLLLRFSLMFGSVAALFFSIRVMIKLVLDRNPDIAEPAWMPAVIVLLASAWCIFSGFGCWLRFRGYRKMRAAAALVGVEGWASAAMWGSLFAMIGTVAMWPALVGRPYLELRAEGLATVMFGLATGLVGLLLEFSVLAVLHRFLWESAGWQAANRTGQYAVTCVFSTVAALASFIAGGLGIIAIAGGVAAQRAPNDPLPEIAVEYRLVGLAVLACVIACVGWCRWRYGQLLRSTGEALAKSQPEPQAVPQPEET